MKQKPKQSSTENTKNTFFAKAIENWLTNTSELGYQLPFCQLLLNEGFSTVHISKHNAFEQGKDVIAIDPDGLTHVYQLKGGNVTLSLWRNILKAELEELIDLTVVHPSVDKSKAFVPYLVTNGYLDDTVRLQIENLNAGKWKASPLQVILLPDLLTRFIRWSYEFTPQEIENYRTFLELYFADGTALVDEAKLSHLLESILRLNETKKLPKAERRRNIGAAILLSGYAMAPQNEKQNHIALAQTLTLVGAYILCVAEKFALDESFWRPSFDLVWAEILTNLERSEKEICDGELEQIYRDLWDGELAPYRGRVAINYLLAYKLAQYIAGDSEWESFKNQPVLAGLMTNLVATGEGGLIGFIFTHYYLSFIGITTEDIFLILPLEVILLNNGRNGDCGMPSPYHSIETAIKMKFGILEEDEIREDFQGRSFLMETLIELLVQRDRRDVLQNLWREISYIQMEKFIPGAAFEWFRWRTKNGTNISEFPIATQSWAELKVRAAIVDEDAIPSSLKSVPHFLPLFLLVFSHRVNSNVVKYLVRLLSTAMVSAIARTS